jgi:hypothetical protein
MEFKCFVNWHELKPKILLEMNTELTISIADLKLDADTAHYKATTADYYKAAETLSKVREILNDYYQQVADRLALLEALSNNRLEGEVLTAMQSKNCITSGHIEKSEISQCERIKDGLVCRVDIQVFTKPALYEYYTPVTYKGVQLKFEQPNQYLVKSNNQIWNLLTCPDDQDNQLDTFDTCTISQYQNLCSSSFSTKDFASYIKNCNFTRTEPPLTLATNAGLLIQGENVQVKLINKTSNQVTEITDPLPIVCSTEKIVQVSQGSQLINWESNVLVLSDQIIRSWLSSQDIEKLQSTVQTTEMLNSIEIEDIIDLVLIIIVLVLIPIIGMIL